MSRETLDRLYKRLDNIDLEYDKKIEKLRDRQLVESQIVWQQIHDLKEEMNDGLADFRTSQFTEIK